MTKQTQCNYVSSLPILYTFFQNFDLQFELLVFQIKFLLCNFQNRISNCVFSFSRSFIQVRFHCPSLRSWRFWEVVEEEDGVQGTGLSFWIDFISSMPSVQLNIPLHLKKVPIHNARPSLRHTETFDHRRVFTTENIWKNWLKHNYTKLTIIWKIITCFHA